jgi:membrane protein YqaA with SNARE-associated domain
MIIRFLDNRKKQLRDWVLRWAHSAHSQAALFLLSFSESAFFPVPPDLLLIAILSAGAKHWLYYAGVTLLGSVLGGLFGYFIGWGLYETVGYRIVDFYNLNEAINIIGMKYSEHAFLTVFIAAFTPIPYKVITISAGLFKVEFFAFIAASLVGRGARFFAVAFLMRLFGRQLARMLYKYFNLFSLIAGALVIAGFIGLKLLF